MRGLLLALLCCTLALPARLSAQAQQPTDTKAVKQERLGEHHFKLTGNVEVTMGDSTLFAEEVEMFDDQNRAIATGNVVFTQGKNRISADRADFDTKTRLGTFYNATGIASIQPPRPQPGPGGFAPPPALNQETDVYFYGDKVEKIGVKKYRITNGGFTTCVQPTPRWELTSGTVVVNVDHYTFLRDSVFKVKGVPMLYVPVLYYPTKKEDRATGFLIPTYGSSTIRGQSIHNAFFWAMNRSQDATFLHDWFSHTGQGVGTEYRYNYGAASNGNFRAYMLDEHEAEYTLDNGESSTLPASRSFELRGGANQQLPFGLRARANVDYFSSLQMAQTFNTNVYDASRRQRIFGGNVIGLWGSYTLNGTFDRSEFFYNETSSSVSGNTPRIMLTRSERPLWSGAPLYFTAAGEYSHLLAESHTTDPTSTASTQVLEKNVSRLDFTPQIRFPFKKWQWFTVNSTLAWRDTFYTRSQVPNGDQSQQSTYVDESLNRRYYTLQSQIVGPVFNRIWDTPDNGYAEKFKHTIEPVFTVSKTSDVENFDRIISTDATDTVVGGTQYAYGVNNRFYAKRRQGRIHQAVEIFDVELRQTYYTNQLAAQFDPRYTTSFSSAARPSKFSPIQLSLRAMPANTVNGTMRFEFDSRTHQLATVSAQAAVNPSPRLQTSIGWSKTNVVEQSTQFTTASHAITATANLRAADNRLGSVYSFNYDIGRSTMVQQRISGYYNAQCCGIALEYQTYNFGGYAPVPADHRFFLSFTLAGIGNFSPFNGAMSGVPR